MTDFQEHSSEETVPSTDAAPTSEADSREPDSRETEEVLDLDSEAAGDAVETPVVQLAPAVEAICMVSDQPVPAVLIADVLGVSADKIDEVCEEVAQQYRTEGRGFVLAKVAGGWRYQSHADQAAYVEKFVLDGQSARLSGAALETMAIVAYKQPISRAQIAAIRGVNVDGVLKTLQQRGYVTDQGHEPGPSGATLFSTTPQFLERLGIASLADLPPLGDFVPDVELVEALEHGLRPAAAGTIEPGDD